MDLLKVEAGIEVRSASSTIEEVVARQFVERHARKRNISLPPAAQMFNEGPPQRPGMAKKQPGKGPAVPEAPKVAPLPPPRLVKALKVPGAPAASGTYAEAPASVAHPPAFEAHPAAVATAAAVDTHEPDARETSAPVETPPPAAFNGPAPVLEAAPAVERAPEPETAVAAPPPPAPIVDAPVAAEATDASASALGEDDIDPTGARQVPSSLRLRVEDPNRQVSAPPMRPARPAPPVPPPPVRRAPMPPTAGPAGPPRPATAGPRPLPPGAALPGGPRPLPSQPIRSPLPQVARPSYQPTYANIGRAPGVVGPGGRPLGGPPGAPGMVQPGQRPGAAQFPRPPQPGGGYRPGGAPGGHRPRPGGRSSGGRRTRIEAPVVQGPAAPPPITRIITLAEGMTVKDLADKLEAKVKDVMRVILEQGMRMTINSTLDADTATMLARQFGAEVEVRSFEEEIVEFEEGVSRPEDRETRAPVVTVMGHVDHGKTTLLDSLRTTRVAEREAGGITQHIGAYAVELNDRKIVFLDTPGHAAFTTMRARGAKVTDVVVLVVAADDGVMPQTREAIDHAKAAKVPIIVAINKIDKPDSNPERVMRELSEIGLLAESWGGDTVMVPVSAKAKQNLDQLLEMILLVTEIGDLKANAARNASGTVLEGKLDRGRGPVATVLVQDGTLHVGDTVLVGTIVGKVRALQDDRGRSVREVGPSTPVEVLGLGGVPTPGDTFQAVEDVAKARQIAMFREEQAKAKSLGARGGRMTLETLQKHIAEGGVKELALIIKADVQGSAEVLADSLQKLGDERVKVRVISSGVGAINESDVLLATASEAIIIGFNVRPDRNAEALANREKVDIRLHSIIYNVTDEMKAAMAGMLEPVFKDARIGMAEVREVFKTPKAGTVAGCLVTEGVIRRSGDAQARLLRDGVVVHTGKLSSLRRFKDDVSEVKNGLECGMTFERYNDVKVGDIIEVFVSEEVAVTIPG
ncbi:Translation initiation factor IF-2 [Luteitalea pratensis]|uniref:Translation initiation factor IF-2 n=2 Tax=Luteitalea pratensis TaxID=1855912 RepID=A0A143PUQ7_LUTPR|nr:Translation initiation factor IF-2 [Luteitalea pratensis]